MKVEKANFNLQQIPMNQSPVQFAKPGAQAASFTGHYNSTDIYKELMHYMPRSVKLMMKAKEWTGEVQNIVINSVGTGLIAPIFIKYNP